MTDDWRVNGLLLPDPLIRLLEFHMGGWGSAALALPHPCTGRAT